jgi:hypothetical protein
VKTDPGQYDLGKDLENTNVVLVEIEYYGLLIKYDVFEESELLKNDRRKVYEIWRTLNLAGKDVQDKIRKLKLEKKYDRKVKKHNNLIASIIKYWGPNPKEEDTE